MKPHILFICIAIVAFPLMAAGQIVTLTGKVTGTDNKPLKRGRGSQKKSKVLLMVESEPTDGKTAISQEKSRKEGHIKMIVIQDLKSDTITPLVKANVCAQSTIDFDHSTS